MPLALSAEIRCMSRTKSPETRLWLAVLARAIDDACITDVQLSRLSKESRTQMIGMRDDARRFFASGRFAHIAEICGIAPEYMSRRLRAIYPWAADMPMDPAASVPDRGSRAGAGHTAPLRG